MTGRITISDLLSFIPGLRAGVEADSGKGKRAAEKRELLKKIDAFLAEATTDARAELLGRGFLLGMACARFNREIYYGSVQRLNIDKGRKTKAARLDERDLRMLARYDELRLDCEDLEARKILVKEFELGLGLPHIKARLERARKLEEAK